MWGRLVGATGTLDLVLPRSRLGRLAKKADVVINKPFISGLHCTFERLDAGGETSVWLVDHSTNGVFVNGSVVGHSNRVAINDQDEISFTKPGVKSPGIEPLFFRFCLTYTIPMQSLEAHNSLPRKSEPSTPTHRVGQKRPRSPFSTPEPRAVIDSAKKLCVSSTTQRDELISGTEAMQKANQDLRQRLVEHGNRENELKEKIQTMLVTINEKDSTIEKMDEEHAKLRAQVMQQDHTIQDLTAHLDAYKSLEEGWKTKEVEWAQQKELHLTTAADLSAAQRQLQHAQSVISVLEAQAAETSTKMAEATQQVRDLEVANHQLQMQLDAVQMKREQHEEDSRRSVQESVLVMKARLATAREAFHQMQHYMGVLATQIQIPSLSEAQDTDAAVDDEDDGETQCMDKARPQSLVDLAGSAKHEAATTNSEEVKSQEPPLAVKPKEARRLFTTTSDSDEGTKPTEARSDDDEDSDEDMTAEHRPESKALSPDETHVMDITTDSPREAAPPALVEAKSKRWLQLNTMDESHNDSETGLFDETQISQDLQDE
ncbi:hypothetical protein SPRG_11698 [Saprolegnia parasitica CBS 223.65]|uniref:FHA domain-containing protein n=1 Tax=Saprolegnia parasitica (strain CBS 223.65) TaxID=695850 RepID=A0A067BVE9_SAPPC|nr:hypothetical protein SPRG_11698 [Saprolegnia parasitica CBS 223.65]KDO22514.1 hypothetical protein SPRG_11698 [Saprolegnia parasitica CBS 223.65]|eukprot:XP_012206762.1 hypothetical protein SPRG_11698 [Saprolegnia parasitica CBS 223.65]